MSEYKLIVTTGLAAEDTLLIADAIFEAHSVEYDAAAGEFSIISEEKELTITLLNVADGDVRSLAELILEGHGDVDLRASKDGFPFDLEED